MKIIKVNGCHDCVPDYTKYTYNHVRFCAHPDRKMDSYDDSILIQSHIDTKTLPDNCPLEDEPSYGRVHSSYGMSRSC